jgi:hypothetical protein
MDYTDMRPSVDYPREPLDFELWDLLEQDPGPRLALLTAREMKAVMLLLQVLASGDGVGHEQALTLIGRIDRRLPESDEREEISTQPTSARQQAYVAMIEQARIEVGMQIPASTD